MTRRLGWPRLLAGAIERFEVSFPLTRNWSRNRLKAGKFEFPVLKKLPLQYLRQVLFDTERSRGRLDVPMWNSVTSM